MTRQYTGLGPGDLGREPPERPDNEHDWIDNEPDDPFLAAVWQVLVDNSPEIDKFMLAYRDMPNIGLHNWAGVIQEIAAAVAKVQADKPS